MTDITYRQIEVEGRKRHVLLGGSGRPVVVLEPAIGDVAATWMPVFRDATRYATVFTHDRPGLGDSEPSDRPRTVEEMVAELRAAMAALELEPPYLLVAHSFSSLTVQLFALLHPAEVSGLVLVDGAHEDQMERFPQELNPRPMLAAYAEQLQQAADAARRGEDVPHLMPAPPSFSDGDAKVYRSGTRPSPTRLETVAAEYQALEESQTQLRKRVRHGLGALPLTVISHGVPQSMPGVSDEVNLRYEQTWQELQKELAARSSRSEVLIADGAGHMIHHDRPDVVVEAIRRMLVPRLNGTRRQNQRPDLRSTVRMSPGNDSPRCDPPRISSLDRCL